MEIAVATSVEEFMSDVMRLYAATREQAEYEELTREYLRDVLTEARHRAHCATFDDNDPSMLDAKTRS